MRIEAKFTNVFLLVVVEYYNEILEFAISFFILNQFCYFTLKSPNYTVTHPGYMTPLLKNTKAMKKYDRQDIKWINSPWNERKYSSKSLKW